MSLIPVNPVDREGWRHIEPLLSGAFARVPSKDWRVEDVRELANQGLVDLWAVMDEEGFVVGAGATQVMAYPRRRVLEVLAFAGAWRAALEDLKTVAKAAGCSAISGHGRPGWVRALLAQEVPGWEIDLDGPRALEIAKEMQLEVRSSIDALEGAMRREVASGALEQTLSEGGTEEGNGQCSHHFGDGVYVRSLWIPAGTAVVGRLHKQARVCMVLAGRCKFIDEFHEEEVAAPWIGEFKAGSKTAVLAITDTLWCACLGTDLKDPREAFYKLTAGSHSELLGCDL